MARGAEFHAVVEQRRRSMARDIRLLTPHQAVPSARMRVTLAQAVLKGDKMDDVVRDAVMMGVAAILPLVTARSEVSLAALERGRRRERWQRIAVIARPSSVDEPWFQRVLEPVAFSTLMSTTDRRRERARRCC